MKGSTIAGNSVSGAGGSTLGANVFLESSNGMSLKSTIISKPDNNACSGTLVTNNSSCTVDVAFHPVSPNDGGRNSSLSFPTDVAPAASVGSIALSGTATGYTPAAISLAPTSHDFGSTQAGTPTGATEFVVTNTGLDTTGNLSVALTGANASEFGITQEDCRPVSVPQR